MKNASFTAYRLWDGSDGYTNHRIPGIIVTHKGTLIVYNEARRSGSDWALMDIFCQRSEDGGAQFGAPIVLAEGTQEHPTVNNPVMMQDKNGRIHLLFCKDYTIRGSGAWHRYSDDDGKSWSEARDVTEATCPEMHDAFAFGPGHGICTREGLLLVPVWLVEKGKGADDKITSHWPSVIHTFYSEDNGETWRLGERVPTGEDVPNPNETAAAQCSDGCILLNIRNFRKRRAKSWSGTGKDGWTLAQPDEVLIDPLCFGSMIACELDGRHALVMVNCASTEARQNVTLRVSFDDSATWSLRRTVDADRGGYADLAMDEKQNCLYVLYEEKAGVETYLAKMDREWLLK